MQLAQLEREAGVKLLRRAGRNVELTPAGRRLAAYAAHALAADETVRAELATIGDALTGRLRMTIVQTTAIAGMVRGITSWTLRFDVRPAAHSGAPEPDLQHALT